METTYHANQATAQGHNGHATRDALHQDIFDRREGEAQVRRQQFENSEAHEAGRHGHDGYPTSLQAKVDVGGADDGTNQQASRHATRREAAPGRHGRRSHGCIRTAIYPNESNQLWRDMKEQRDSYSQKLAWRWFVDEGWIEADDGPHSCRSTADRRGQLLSHPMFRSFDS
jgi:hypothetical protein